jgi:hypothetical protein
LTRFLDLSLPEPERLLAAHLRGGWRDFLYAPGPGFTSPLEPGIYSSSFVIVLGDGRLVRVSSLVTPAFGGELCRLRLEALETCRTEVLGSFFEPARRGQIYALSADRRAGSTRAPEEPGWSYDGASLADRFTDVRAIRVLRERARGGAGDDAVSWVAERGLVLASASRAESLLLALPGPSENAALASPLGLYRALIDPAALSVPGASPADLLGYGDGAPGVDLAVDLEALPADV